MADVSPRSQLDERLRSGLFLSLRGMALSLPTLLELEQQGEIRAFRGRLCWEGDLEAERLDCSPSSADPKHG